jgi:hypothetical protein
MRLSHSLVTARCASPHRRKSSVERCERRAPIPNQQGAVPFVLTSTHEIWL